MVRIRPKLNVLKPNTHASTIKFLVYNIKLRILPLMEATTVIRTQCIEPNLLD